MKTIHQIRSITDQYDKLELDCVGLTSVLHHVLERNGIAHKMYVGGNGYQYGIREDAALYNRVSCKGIPHHAWIELETKQGKAVIDYRARVWIGSEGNTPHGVFLKSEYPHMRYAGNKIDALYPSEAVLHLIDPENYSCPENLQEIEEEMERGVLSEWTASSHTH